MTFQHVAQAGFLSAESSSAEDSLPLKERNLKSNDDGNVAVASKQLRRQPKKRQAPTAEQQGQELVKESQIQAKILKVSIWPTGFF